MHPGDEANHGHLQEIPQFYLPNSVATSSYHQRSDMPQKLNSPSSFNHTQQHFASGQQPNADTELTRIMYETDNNGFFNMSQVLATSENG